MNNPMIGSTTVTRKTTQAMLLSAINFRFLGKLFKDPSNEENQLETEETPFQYNAIKTSRHIRQREDYTKSQVAVRKTNTFPNIGKKSDNLLFRTRKTD